jgi:hypothetical protein
VGGERVAGREEVAMGVHAALRQPGRARREGDQRDVLGGRLDGLEPGRPGRRALLQLGAGPEGQQLPQDRLLGLRGHRLAGHPSIGEPVGDLGLRDHLAQLTRAQQRHRRDHDAAGQEDPEPARHQLRGVGPVQQDPVAGHQPHVVDEHAGDALGPVAQVGVGPGLIVAVDARALVEPPVQQRDGRVHPLGILELGQGEEQVRPLLPRRQVVPGEGVDVRSLRHW